MYGCESNNHSRKVGDDLYIWDVHRLIRRAKELPRMQIPLSQIAEIDELWWYQTDSDIPTPQTLSEHMILVQKADLKYPIILCSEGRLMDGMHRVVRALAEGQATISAVKFEETPEPDFINVDVDSLPYPDEDV